VYDVVSNAPVAGAEVAVEGTGRRTVADSAGRYLLTDVPAGVRTLLVRRIGYSFVRVTLTIPAGGIVTRDIELARSALHLPDITVTARPAERARGELGTASVIDRSAIENQTATSLAGILELVPGVALQPPGLGATQQFALRSVATTGAVAATAGGPGASDLASFGTSIVLDGVPVSNNANLQTLGPRGELFNLVNSSAGGGVDLRQIPASTVERVEVIRGVPSARYGDVTQGVIVVDTRAGAVRPTARASYDPNTFQTNLVGGRAVGSRHTITLDADVSHTLISPGTANDDTWRITGQLAHRLGPGPAGGGLTLDTRVRFFQVNQDNPEQPEIVPGQAATNHDRGLRLVERVAVGREGDRRATLTASLDHTIRRATAQNYVVRGGLPITDRLTEGTQVGRFVPGSYLARLGLSGREWNLYSRLEVEQPLRFLGALQTVRAGAELRREWNTGAGYEFDVTAPPQISFNGVQGFDRPHRFDAVPPLVTSALYLDDRLRTGFGTVGFEMQAGLRADLLHQGSSWVTGVRDAVVEPRLNAQLSPFPWLRLRGGWGRTAKTPSLASLYPPPQYFDVINVNYFANDPAERLAVLTTFIRDPTNPDLGFAVARKVEAGIELASPGGDVGLSLVAFRDEITDGVGFLPDPEFVPRDRFDLDATVAGQPPTVLQPPIGTDTMPVLIDRPANILTQENRGYEATLVLPELRPLRLTLAAQGAWIKTRFVQEGPDFGRAFSDFQLNPAVPRSPYWDGVVRKGERALATYRLIHHQPRLGLVVTLVVQHILDQSQGDSLGTDTLAFAGYVTRTGELVPVPAAERGDPLYADLRVTRTGQFTPENPTPADWLLSVQVSKALPLGGEFRFYAFNLLDRQGRILERGQRTWPSLRFGVELTMPLPDFLSAEGGP
jgi:outer membrane receptor protein involved in Fe transport